MFEYAIDAKIPVIGVYTDDPVNFVRVANFITKKKVVEFPKEPKTLSPFIYFTDEEDRINVEKYELLQNTGTSCIVLNPDKGNNLIFYAGAMPTPEVLVKQLLHELLESDAFVAKMYPCVRGLSLKSVREVINITAASDDEGGVSIPSVRKMRARMFGSTQGLHLEDTSYDFYDWHPELRKWLELNSSYFLKDVHYKLVPRGVLLDGKPGVGKTMGAKAIANEFGVPLYRFSIDSILDKYIGVAERQLEVILNTIDRESPCVVLMDEMEKIFGIKDETGVMNRMLSRILWWLAEHRSRVFTVMTTNKMDDLPKELYRPGRIDAVFKVNPLIIPRAVDFSNRVYASVMGKDPDMKVQMHVRNVIENYAKTHKVSDLAHAEVCELVYTEIKINKWA